MPYTHLVYYAREVRGIADAPALVSELQVAGSRSAGEIMPNLFCHMNALKSCKGGAGGTHIIHSVSSGGLLLKVSVLLASSDPCRRGVLSASCLQHHV